MPTAAKQRTEKRREYNMDNLLSLSREGGITSSRKGIVDNLSMTYDGGTDC